MKGGAFVKRKSSLPELLAPAGSFEALLAAVAGGADAVYVGGKAFGARAYAKNFDIEELERAVVYCHLHGVRLYVTVNTLVFDREMKELSDYAAKLWEIGVDAVIITDLGAIREIKRRVPGLELHASTQMSVHSTDGAKIAAELGCSRVVLARELSYENICKTTEASPVETEVFLHGALCVCHSGQCLVSSLVGGRSGNRGECAQPCRLPYGDSYPLSLSDLSLAGHIEKLIRSGVASLKIEGRMKSPDYVYTVTSTYRRLLDEHRSANDAENRTLRAAFSRGGFTDGYFTSRTQSKMTGIRTEEDKSDTKSLGERSFTPMTRAVRAHAKILRDRPAELTFTLDSRKVTVLGETPSPAISAPLTEDAVKERLAKLGGTYLTLAPEDIELELDSGLNLSPAMLNAMRREAADGITSAKRESANTEFAPFIAKGRGEKLNTALFLKANLLTKVYKSASECFDVIFAPLFDYAAVADMANGVYLPPVITDSERERVSDELEAAIALGAKYALVGNVGHIALLRGKSLVPIGDFRLNITNSSAKESYAELGIELSEVSAELTLPMARDVGGGAIIYGRIPLMLTERCFIKENFGCERCSATSLCDRMGAKFPIIREFEHRNLILNSALTYMGDKTSELDAARIFQRHAIFSVESEAEALAAIAAIKDKRALDSSLQIRRMGKRDAEKAKPNDKRPAPVRNNPQKPHKKAGKNKFQNKKR